MREKRVRAVSSERITHTIIAFTEFRGWSAVPGGPERTRPTAITCRFEETKVGRVTGHSEGSIVRDTCTLETSTGATFSGGVNRTRGTIWDRGRNTGKIRVTVGDRTFTRLNRALMLRGAWNDLRTEILCKLLKHGQRIHVD